MAGGIVIVGGGQAGFEVANQLRLGGYKDALTLLCGEDVLPYQRPPLSKDYLQGGLAQERLFFRPQSFYAENDIAVRLQTKAQAIDTKSKQVVLEKESLPYDRLVLATGAKARVLPNISAGRSLVSLADSKALQSQLAKKNWVIIGGGYIGLEVAATARKAGCAVSIVEAAGCVLGRVTAPIMSDFFATLHRTAGVQLFCDSTITASTKSHLQLQDGTSLPSEVVLVGIGVAPETQLAQASGIDCDNTSGGIIVDANGATSQKDIYACGDCTAQHDTFYDRLIHLESVQNALTQAKQVSAHLLGKPAPAYQAPWFWSNQYDIKLQIAGLSAGYDELVLRGDIASKSFALFYLKQGRLLACDAVNRPAEFMMTRRLLGAGKSPSPASLRDEASNPKEWG